MKLLNLSTEDTAKCHERIEGIIRRASTPGNTSCLYIHMDGKEVTIGRSGHRNTARLRVMFRSGEDLIYLDLDSKGTRRSDDKSFWFFVDLKRNRYYAVMNDQYGQRFIDVSLMVILYALPDVLGELPKKWLFESGCYCANDKCTVLYDKDILGSIANLSENYFNDFNALNPYNVSDKEEKNDG